MGISWQETENQECIGRKYIDKSIFKYGIHIPLQYREGFYKNIKDHYIELGKSQGIRLIFDNYDAAVEIRNINSKSRSETIQIRYDSNKEFKEYLTNKFKYTYSLIVDEENEIDTDEYIDFYRGKELNTFYIKCNMHNTLNKEVEDFINTIKTTSMSKSYKIPLLWAFYNNGNIKLKINEDDIYNSFKDFYSKEENGVDLQGQKSTENYKSWGKDEYIKLAKNGPIKYLLGGTSKYFYKENDLFCLSENLASYIKEKEFIQEFKEAIESLEYKYYKREVNRLKESYKDNMELKELIRSFEGEYEKNYNIEEDEKLRDEFLNKFPMDDLKDLELERYALGYKTDNLCWWLEYNTIPLGSIRGGNAKKFKIYYANEGQTWIYPINQFSSVEEAWNNLRGSIYNFVKEFSLGNYDNLNNSGIISSMKMFKTKLLYMYFPEKLLPVYSIEHIQKLLDYFGHSNNEIKKLDIVEVNMKLKAFKDSSEEFKNWDGLKFMRFLYSSIFPKLNIDEISAKDIYDEDGSEYVEKIEEKEEVYMESNQIIKIINNYINSKGYTYKQEQLSNLYLSLKTKPFVILAGISGTGKSKIVRLFADSIGANYHLISVRPDWNDGSDLLGYKNLKDEFIEGQLTKIIIEASKQENKNKPYLICLDEMNLARVEYYLSDYLSIIESRQKIDQDIITDNLIEDKKLHIPDNVYIIGTVNMDETTFTFSRKVLDRANTIEFSDVYLESLFTNKNKEIIGSLNINNSFLKTNYLKADDIEEEYREYALEVNKKIIEINEILKKSKRQFAYRVRDEILFYMVENKKVDLLNENLAFDYQIMQKILPAISGSESSVKNVLIDLFNFVCEKTIIDDIELEEAQNYIDKNIDFIKYKNSAEKIIYMLKGYSEDGYVSYWY